MAVSEQVQFAGAGPTHKHSVHVRARSAADRNQTMNAAHKWQTCLTHSPHSAGGKRLRLFHNRCCVRYVRCCCCRCRGVYAASKAAVMRLTDSMRLECAPLGIKVMLVSPGFVSTNARSKAKVCI